MSKINHRIIVSKVSDIKLRLSYEGPADYAAWKTVFINWNDENSSSDLYIDVNLENAKDILLWLRKNWIASGGEIIVEDDARAAIKNSNLSIETFRSELYSGYQNIEPVDDTHLKRPLTKFQKLDVSRLINLKAGANFSVPGAGKTSTTLVVWDLLKKNNKGLKLLVVAPKSAHEAWEDEPKAVFHNSIKTQIFDDQPISSETDILVVNYERLENNSRIRRLERWLTHNHACLILDEAHRIKGGMKSVRWRACRKLALLAKRVDLLTGTPMPQSFDDLRNLFKISWPYIPSRELSDDILMNMKRGSVFVRTTKEELSLPPVSIQSVSLPPGRIQSDIYSALRKSYAGSFKLSDADHSYFGKKGRAVMTLLAAATNPGLVVGASREDAYLGLEWPPRDIKLDESLINMVAGYASIEMPPKYIWIRQRCEIARQNNQKILIWSTLVGNIKALAKVLETLNPAVVHGGIKDDFRELEIERFRNDPTCTVLISNPQTLGEGVSFHKHCHEAIYLDRSYNAGHYLQSIDRIHRLGLPPAQSTNVFILKTAHTIDERIGVRLEKKIERLANALNDEGLVKTTLPDDSLTTPDELLGIDQFDLDDLFEHLKSDE